MNEMLTLEEISDIDTISLQQHIEALQSHPQRHIHAQLIAIAKLQLHERYKIEQFAHKIINDEICPFPDITWAPPVAQKPEKRTNHNSQRKMEIGQCLRRTLIEEDEHITVGRPALGNYRYVPKTMSGAVDRSGCTSRKPIPKIQAKKSKMVKSSLMAVSAKPPPVTNKKTINQMSSNNPSNSINNTQIQPQKQLITTVQVQTVVQTLQQPQQPPQLCVPVIPLRMPQISLGIKYVENDVYDEDAVMLEKPLKLAELRVDSEAVEDTQPDTITEDCKEEIRQNVLQEVIQDQATKIEEPGQKQFLLQPLHQQLIIEQILINRSTMQVQDEISCVKQTKQYSCIEPVGRQSKIVPGQDYKHQIEAIIHHNLSLVPDKQPMHQADPMQKPSVKSKPRSISQSTNNLGGGRRDHPAVTHSEKQLGPKQKLMAAAIDKTSQATKTRNQTQNNFSKNNKMLTIDPPKQRQSVAPSRLRQLEPPTFNYSEIVPSFARLFPHCANLHMDIRTIEQQLEDHLHKGISRLSLNDEYLRIRENQLYFNTVAESQRASKLAHVFDIGVDEFVSKGNIMVRRIRNECKKPSESEILLYRVVRQREDVYDIINNAFHRTRDWYELPHGMESKTSWNLLWTWSKPQISIRDLFYFQKINHFFGNKQIARKDLLKKNIERIKKLGPKANSSFDIIPETYYLPGENMQFIRKFKQCAHKPGRNLWIMKPVGLSRGRGIELVDKIQDIVFSEPVVLQKYLANPLLLQGHKFDMRIYVLVTSINPLEAYVYKEGFARISTQKYSLEEGETKNKFVHLTNYSVQKQQFEAENTAKLGNFSLSNLEKELGGCKITLKMLRQKLTRQAISWPDIEAQIDSIVLKSLISVMNSIEPNPNCFQLFGYDIIIDQDLRCWLIEVNSSPSLEKDFPIDQIIKQQLVDDIIAIVDPVPYDRARLLEVITRRRKEMQGLKSHINTQNNSSSQLNADLHYVLHGRPLRKYGQAVGNGNFRRLAPGELYQSILKTVQQYKLTSICKQTLN